MPRDEWNKTYAKRMQQQSAIEPKFAMECATGSDDAYNDGVAPVNAADEEMAHWDNDE